MKWNWKTTLGGVIFILGAVASQLGLVPDVISTNAEIIGVIILAIFAKDK